MIIKSVTQVGNPIIRRKSRKVVSVTSKEIKKAVADLIDSMRHANLVGMAAPQIGRNLRIFVTEIRQTTLRKTNESDSVRIFINPRIVHFSKGKSVGYEGCGSVASTNIFGKVSRPAQVTVEALNEKGEKFTLTAKGLLARVIQHELDHLDGVIFLDKVTDTRSLVSKEEYIKE